MDQRKAQMRWLRRKMFGGASVRVGGPFPAAAGADAPPEPMIGAQEVPALARLNPRCRPFKR